MEGSGPSPSAVKASVELGSEHLVEDDETRDQRASLLNAAANTRNVAMLTGTHGVVAMPLDRAIVTLPEPSALAPRDVVFEAREDESPLAALLRARITGLERGEAEDRVALARAHLELARVKLDEGDVPQAKVAAEAALATDRHATAARAMLRVLADKRGDVTRQLEEVSALATDVAGALASADYHAEKARLLEAQAGPSAASVDAYAEALGLVVDHPGALEGLETALLSLERWSELSVHLGRLAGLATDPKTAAWFLVERALVIDRRLGDEPSSRALLDRALTLDGGLGPVRQATVDHAVAHRDDARLAALLEAEAELEPSSTRSASLFLDAALLHMRAKTDAARVARVLERAHGRAPTTPLIDARVTDELAHIYETSELFVDALRVRKAALRTCASPSEELAALRSLARVAERASAPDDVVMALERARVLDPEDPTLLEELDRVLIAGNRHEVRAVMWVREAALADDPQAKAHALLTSAEALVAAGRTAEAARQLQSAWVTAPDAPGIFEALAERLTPAAPRAAVAERIALYERAAHASEPARKLAYLEKIAWLYDDVVGDPAAAASAYEAVLAVDERRASAIAGLVSCAARAGDRPRLARALLAEVSITQDAGRRAELRLRAAEALAGFDADRARTLVEELVEDEHVGARAGALETRLYETSGRWELAQASLGRRAEREIDQRKQASLVSARATMLWHVLGAPARALEVLEAFSPDGATPTAIASARIAALRAISDETRLRRELERLGDEPGTPLATRVSRFVVAAELEEQREGGDDEAVRLYHRARELAPDEPLVRERLLRLGARVTVPLDPAQLVTRAVRALDNDAAEGVTAEVLLERGAHEIATLRLAERAARKARSGPQLANTLALEAKQQSGTMALRALVGLAALVTWTLPAGDDIDPWAQLLAVGTHDVVALDELVWRVRSLVRLADRPATELSIEALSRRLSDTDDPTERLLLHLDLSRAERLVGRIKEAATHAQSALAIDRSSVSGAVLLAELAAQLGDRRLAIEAGRALADVTVEGRSRAALLRDVADLSIVEKDLAGAAEALERALSSDPESVPVAARLAQIQLSRDAAESLARALRRGIHAATSPEAVVPMAAELAEVARSRLSDPLLAIEALVRSREVAPTHLPALFLLAELYIGQRAWEKALEALADVAQSASEPSERITALVGRASIFRRALGDVVAAEKELRAALAIDGHDVRVLRSLLDLRGVLPTEERAELLSRFVALEDRPAVRLASLLELADARQALGDAEGAEGALTEAASLSPDEAMLERLRTLAGGNAELGARLLGRGLSRARERGGRPPAVWLANLGEFELTLGRIEDAIGHLEEAVELEPSRGRSRLALAHALSTKGRHGMVVDTLVPLFDNPSTTLDAGFVRMLGEALKRSGRAPEARVIDELRLLMGDRDATVRAAVEAPRAALLTGEPVLGQLLRAAVIPASFGGHAFWDVAALTSGIAGKLARVPLSERGASTKARIKPRAIHPLRQLVDRAARAFDLVDLELAVSEDISEPVLAIEDVPWLVVPARLVEEHETQALAALARPLVALSLGIPWYGAIGTAEVLAIVVALGRQVAPRFGASLSSETSSLADEVEPRVRRALDRKKRKTLDELAPMLEAAAPFSESGFVELMTCTDARAALLLSGDLRASLATVTGTDPVFEGAARANDASVLGALLSRTPTRDLLAFALRPETVALRRALGTL